MAFTSKYTGAQIDAKLDSVDKKQDALVNGTNIKTINGESILGSGDIVISGGDTEDLELVTAAAITDLDSRVKELEGEDAKIKEDITQLQNDVQARATKTEVNEANEAITNKIIDNEQVTAAALNDLYENKANKAYVDDAIMSAITNTINANY